MQKWNGDEKNTGEKTALHYILYHVAIFKDHFLENW
jgi:hypothetical protein